MPDWVSLDGLRRHPHTCDAETTRKGLAAPCEKPAIAAAIDIDHYGPDQAYAVCSHHARGRDLVPLAVLLGVSDG